MRKREIGHGGGREGEIRRRAEVGINLPHSREVHPKKFGVAKQMIAWGRYCSPLRTSRSPNVPTAGRSPIAHFGIGETNLARQKKGAVPSGGRGREGDGTARKRGTGQAREGGRGPATVRKVVGSSEVDSSGSLLSGLVSETRRSAYAPHKSRSPQYPCDVRRGSWLMLLRTPCQALA